MGRPEKTEERDRLEITLDGCTDAEIRVGTGRLLVRSQESSVTLVGLFRFEPREKPISWGCCFPVVGLRRHGSRHTMRWGRIGELEGRKGGMGPSGFNDVLRVLFNHSQFCILHASVIR